MKTKLLAQITTWLFLVTPLSGMSAPFDIARQGNVLHFNGEISIDSANAILINLKGGARTIQINSTGGDAKAGLLLAIEIEKRKTAVIVEKFCFSTCANYLFVPAHRKSLLPGAVLGFHGGIYGGQNITDKSKILMVQKEKEKLKLLFQQDEAFFEKIGFDRKLIHLSFELTKPATTTYSYTVVSNGVEKSFPTEYEATKVLDEEIAEGKSPELTVTTQAISSNKMYFPKKNTLLRYGVKGIMAYPYPADQKKMTQLARSIDSELEVIGDF